MWRLQILWWQTAQGDYGTSWNARPSIGKGWGGPIHLQRPVISDCSGILLHILGDWSARHHKVMFQAETPLPQVWNSWQMHLGHRTISVLTRFQRLRQRMKIRACNHRTTHKAMRKSKLNSEVSHKRSWRRQGRQEDPHLALLEHRNTPTQGLDTSPAQHLMSSRTRALIPSMPSLMKPSYDKNAHK